MFGDPVKNEKNLPLEQLSKIGILERGKSQHRPRNAPELLGGPYPLIHPGDVSNSNIYITTYSNTYSELGLTSFSTVCVVPLLITMSGACTMA